MKQFSTIFCERVITFLEIGTMVFLLFLPAGCSLWHRGREGGPSGASVSKSQKFSVEGSASLVNKGEEKPSASRSERFRLEGKPGSDVSRSEKFMLEKVGN